MSHTKRLAFFFTAMLALPAWAETCRVVDGDTLRCGARFKERVRISGIDAPELFSPKCREERQLAEQATRRLAALTQGVDVQIAREGHDRYGRTLARLYVRGRDVGAILVAERLAREWNGRREPWCGVAAPRSIDDRNLPSRVPNAVRIYRGVSPAAQ